MRFINPWRRLKRRGRGEVSVGRRKKGYCLIGRSMAFIFSFMLFLFFSSENKGEERETARERRRIISIRVRLLMEREGFGGLLFRIPSFIIPHFSQAHLVRARNVRKTAMHGRFSLADAVVGVPSAPIRRLLRTPRLARSSQVLPWTCNLNFSPQ